jgi:hypothetical protein
LKRRKQIAKAMAPASIAMPLKDRWITAKGLMQNKRVSCQVYVV